MVLSCVCVADETPSRRSGTAVAMRTAAELASWTLVSAPSRGLGPFDFLRLGAIGLGETLAGCATPASFRSFLWLWLWLGIRITAVSSGEPGPRMCRDWSSGSLSMHG